MVPDESTMKGVDFGFLDPLGGRSEPSSDERRRPCSFVALCFFVGRGTSGTLSPSFWVGRGEAPANDPPPAASARLLLASATLCLRISGVMRVCSTTKNNNHHQYRSEEH